MSDARKDALRAVLVNRAAATPRRRPWQLAALLAAVAIGGAATGAVSVAAFGEPAPPAYSDDVIESLALSIARAKTVAVGDPHYVTSDGTVTVDLGVRPDGATGVAVRTACIDAASAEISFDGTWYGGFSCDADGGGGGGVNHVVGNGHHSITIASTSNSRFEAWIVWVAEPPMPEPSQQQLDELADGMVTREEYVAAFNRFATCMTGAGFEIIGPNTQDTVIDYAITDEAVKSGADELCYGTQYQDVDMTWQLQNEATSDTTTTLRECLVANGITPSADYREYWNQVQAAGIDVDTCW